MVYVQFTVWCILLVTVVKYSTSAESWKRSKRQQVGSTCNENIDCLTSTGGAYCDSTKVCACLPTSTSIGGFCWPKINPGQTGCQYQGQCDSVWPGATCDSSNTCRCANNQPPSQTNDGTVCNNAGACPTNGFNSKYKSSNGVEAGCTGLLLVPACSQNDYDCFCSPPPAAGGDCTASLTFCCPSRALACIMPKEEGIFSGGSSQSKFWYNSATDNCEPLFYNGAGGNANNFDSKAQCESYCRTACPRGRPNYVDAAATANPMGVRNPTTCSSTSTTTCGTNYFCNTATTSSGSYCCPTPTFICTSTSGGINTNINQQPTAVPDPGTGAPNLPTRIRWYYNSATQTCASFTYNGQEGNYNNFASASECNAYCARSLCTAGDVLRDTNQNPFRCGTAGTASCPIRYDCSTAGYCCPTRDFVCNLPVASGSCMNYVPRWYYDKNARTCTSFTYNGCQGNFNNFNTFTDCTTFCTDVSTGPKCPQGRADVDSSGAFVVCAGTSSSTISQCNSGFFCYYDGSVYGCCPTQTQTCATETSDPGTSCPPAVTRWYLNTQTNRCTTFTYSGCDGNSNNFATQIDCQDYCNIGGCPEGGDPYRETTNNQNRACTTTGQECPSGYNCARVNIGTTTSASYCCPTRETICRMGNDPGTTCGTNTLTRYWFNTATRLCEAFTYRGCQGNRNNFGTLAQCSNFCNSAGCSAGQVALQVSNVATTCTVGGTGCPSSYSCVQSNLLNQGICCGSNAPPGTCPTGQLAYMDSYTNGPLQCQQGLDGQCQAGFFCQYSPTQTNNFCCGTSVVTCPSGGSVSLNAAGQPVQCTPNVASNCASGFTCQPTNVLVGTVQSSTGYCCGTPNPCGQGYTTQFQNNQPQTCITGAATTTCTSPYTCITTTSGSSYCCVQATVNVPVCATGKNPLMILNAPTICNTANAATSCPTGYTCDYYLAANSNYCCSGGTITNTRCPTGYTVLLPEQTCGTSPDTCPTAQGALCSFDRTTSRFICCSGGTIIPPATSTVCPSGGQPLTGTTCTRSAQCPAGYVCKPSAGSGVCCSAPPSVCSQAQNAGTTCTTATATQRYSYNSATRTCTAFTFQGCSGNDNNFASLQSCEDFCMMGLCTRGKAQVISGQAPQTCTSAANCQANYDCVVPQFGGGSNVCCPGRTATCASAQDPGRVCSAVATTPLSMFYYNSASRTCQPYSFSGCGGNGNSFETAADCQTYCATGATTNPCPTPSTAQLDASNQPVTCTRTACGAAFSCRYTSNSYYCCSRVGVNGCATGTAYLYPGTRSPLSCTQVGPRCPTGYSCVQSSLYTGFQCCSTTATIPQPVVGTSVGASTGTARTTIVCTGNDYCKSRLNLGAVCDSGKCLCRVNESFTNGNCVTASGR